MAPGGATLDDHWTTTGARERIDESFDVVVVQGQSLEALYPSFDAAALPLADAIESAGSRGVWYAHWARGDVELDSRTGVTLIEEGYARAAATHDGVVARVGEAFLIAGLVLPDIPLIGADRSHPTSAGSLLAACVIFQATTGVSPQVPPSIAGLSDDDARALCAIADDGVLCDAGQSLCGDECVPWSAAACGGCDTECDGGDPCRAGVCGCDEGFMGCDETCVDLLSNPRHCGGCGSDCGPLTRCVEGECARIGGALGCFSSGFGPSTGHSGAGDYRVQCLTADSVVTTYGALADIVPGCVAGELGQACSTAIHRFCRGLGASSGFGPVAVSGDAIEVSCLPTATVLRAPVADVRASRCTADPVTCTAAAWSYCIGQGHMAGWTCGSDRRGRGGHLRRRVRAIEVPILGSAAQERRQRSEHMRRAPM